MCWECEIEISKILLTMDLRIIDMSEIMFLVIWYIKLLLLVHVIVYGCELEFRDETLLKGGECKTRENSNFLRKGKTVISVKNSEFF